MILATANQGANVRLGIRIAVSKVIHLWTGSESKVDWSKLLHIPGRRLDSPSYSQALRVRVFPLLIMCVCSSVHTHAHVSPMIEAM